MQWQRSNDKEENMYDNEDLKRRLYYHYDTLKEIYLIVLRVPLN